MSQLPAPARASLGLVAAALSAARGLPRRAVEFPVIAVSTALQVSLRAQQRYAELIAKGDEVLGQLRGVPDEPPAWATFDDLPAAASASATAQDEAAQADLAAALEGEIVAELLEEEAEAEAEADAEEAIAEILDTEALAVPSPEEGRPGTGSTGADRPAAAAADAVPPAPAATPTTGPGASRAARPRKSASGAGTKRATGSRARSTSASGAGTARASGKTVPAPRNGRPSPFDRAGDDAAGPDAAKP